MHKLRVVFMGTPLFSVPILDMLNKNYDVVLVVTQPDKFVGRKKVLTQSPVKEYAITNNIPVLTPIRIRNEYDEILKYNPDIIITAAYGQIIPEEILNFPKYKCINVHASLLPKYRGGAPIQRAIINGEEKTGITIMYMDKEMDTGDIINSKEMIIDKFDTYDSLNIKLSEVSVTLLKDTLENILNGTSKSIKQKNEEATYAKIISRDDEVIDFNDTSLNIYNKIRGLSSNPGAYALLDNKVIKIYNSRISNILSKNKNHGEIMSIYKDGIGVATSDYEIIITDIKIEGKKRMLVKDYLNGIDSKKLIGKTFNEV